uniref:Uncharacterized protein n=1 Tax=Lactuca sativa TaxID=4236 RepID=A0A9R1X2Q6_LACSA|nr:hypothetical protein LSAT_V11C700358950 [Lactuca sativa]
MLLIINIVGQGVLSSFFFKYVGFASAALYGHTLTINSMLGISIVFISMHQFFSPLSKVKDEENRVLELEPVKSNNRYLFIKSVTLTTISTFSYLSQQLTFEMKEGNWNKNELFVTYTVYEV